MSATLKKLTVLVLVIIVALVLMHPVKAQGWWQVHDHVTDNKINSLDFSLSPVLDVPQLLFFYTCSADSLACGIAPSPSPTSTPSPSLGPSPSPSPSPTPSPDPACSVIGEDCADSFDCCEDLICENTNKTCREVSQKERYFNVDVADESFCLYVNNDQALKGAWDTYQGIHQYGPSAPLQAGNGGYNYGYGCLTGPYCPPEEKGWRWWSWHMDPEQVMMVEASIEICDGIPSHVEYGLIDFGRYCPWLAQLTAVGCTNPE